MRTAFRNNPAALLPSGSLDPIEAQAWVVLEMHFLSRPHLLEDARAKLRAALTALRAEGVVDERDLKDRACRMVQMQYGPAPALNDDALPVRTRVA